MKSKLTFLILLLAVFTSCKKTTNVEVKLSTSGKLTYKLTDDAGKGLPNVKVSLMDRQDNYSNTTILLDARLTDPNGQVDFGDLNPKNYLLVTDSPKVNNVTYFIQEYVQVITGAVKHKETKVTDHSGTFTMTVRSYNNNQPLKNIGVIMIPSNKFNYTFSTTVNLKVADFSGVTNDAGLITFKIPSNKSYAVYLYNTLTNASYNYNNSVSVQKDATLNYSMTIYQ
ncbi:hypothetical protein [Pedobacter nyackensis]|uniref:Uncharacterized protein n=1 Tax=Pedobacter nyackensis TaxID=475255 RepID=A0A1W2DC57_9SPHI|nr:hypothetical protein [Pedobacter nyackensis]SMC94722.1 hypothetical protein SAMN04488101_106125 [Pedobacter nyackensis]